MAVKNKSKTPFNEVCDFLVSSEVMRKIYSFTKEGARVIYKLQVEKRLLHLIRNNGRKLFAICKFIFRRK